MVRQYWKDGRVMVTTTRTIGPLHLEDLEPHRFEDLIRQLLYDFRPWNRLEAHHHGEVGEGGTHVHQGDDLVSPHL